MYDINYSYIVLIIKRGIMMKKLLKMAVLTSCICVTVAFAGQSSQFLDVKAVGPSGKLLDVKGFYSANPNKLYSIKALETKSKKGKRYIDVKVISNGAVFANVNVLNNQSPVFNDVKGITQGGNLEIKAVMANGTLLDIKSFKKNHQILIEAVDGNKKFPVVAISGNKERYLLVGLKEKSSDKNANKLVAVKADTRPKLGF
jgi:hypothetical protein